MLKTWIQTEQSFGLGWRSVILLLHKIIIFKIMISSLKAWFSGSDHDSYLKSWFLGFWSWFSYSKSWFQVPNNDFHVSDHDSNLKSWFLSFWSWFSYSKSWFSGLKIWTMIFRFLITRLQPLKLCMKYLFLPTSEISQMRCQSNYCNDDDKHHLTDIIFCWSRIFKSNGHDHCDHILTNWSIQSQPLSRQQRRSRWTGRQLSWRE